MSSAHPAPGAGPASAGGDLAALTALVHRLEENVARVVRGKPEAIRLAFVCLLARGHVLIEDVPGVGKTTLAQALARSLGLQFQRIQFTSDLLPSDIIGVSVFHQRREAFEFVPGPLFANVVLADEINRATPKTQSALLEAMSERRVSVERQRLPLPEPFLVLATQNPNEYIGTFPLPESQLDRFEMSLRLGYPPRADERELLLSGGVERALATLAPVFGPEELLALQARVDTVRLDEKLVDYVLTLAEATRRGEEFQLGVSTRAAQGLCRAAQALALCEGREYTIPDDIQRLVVPVLGHRVVLRRGSGGGDAARRALEQLVTAVPVPV
ncbi:MAG: Holliday junction ATP-dependent DNA helicase RuvB [Acidobacteria bacterium ADurb.Bin051]|nr:MAG: Holliday junction ATP-dependent DNA helicase RuvB [Acidobacteria bacterium ADurb.Bin051]